ncbi:hypothetical protein COL516b_003178 [Colletotrichum fioriniae]|nr:uncharacterized protein COL516b_003178 [Colletotrichum fioriniae]KAJ0308634.1 hypothetical protein COL516b_003178 [Colletotrichum fioriniae]
MLTHGRNVSYDIPDSKLPQVSQWLIGNPNRINLGRIGLKYKGETLSAAAIAEPRQELDLWSGIITSTFRVDGNTVKVITQGDFATDAVTFKIESDLVSSGDLNIELDFPYPPIHTTKYKYEVFAGVYDFPLNHTTRIVNSCGRSDLAHIHHELQETSYFINLRWPHEAPLNLSRDETEGSVKINAHRYTLSPVGGRNQTSTSLTFTADFSPQKQDPRPPVDVQEASIAEWHDYWNEGGFVDLTLSSNPNATELQRRIILSQYHVRVNSAASGQSPQESGLMNNGWYELAYQSSPSDDTLKQWDAVLTATADYMASYAWRNESSGHYDLGPPSYGVTENTPPSQTLNLAYEIAYWRYGLDLAREWKKRLGQPIPEKWTEVAENLAPPPQVDGLYAVYEGLSSTWWQDPALNGDPRSLIMMQGILPDTPAVDPDVALKTADKVWEVWTDQKIRGWGRPVLAINSARIGNPERAIYHLTAYDYWKFDDAGYAIRGGDGGTPPPFMPGNAGFLYAVAYMAAGGQGSEGDAPGFPKGAGWVVKQEGLQKAP